MKFLHSMIRVSDPQATVAFFQLLGLEERRRMDNEAGRFTLIFLGVRGDDGGGVELCVAACEGGALGFLPCGMLTPDQVRNQVAEVRSRTNRPFGLNFFCHAMPGDVDDSAWRSLLQPYYEQFDVRPAEGGALR